MAYYETNLKNKLRVLTRVEKTIEYHESISKIANSKKLHGCLNDLLGEDCVLFKDKINYKRPGGSGQSLRHSPAAFWGNFKSPYAAAY